MTKRRCLRILEDFEANLMRSNARFAFADVCLYKERIYFYNLVLLSYETFRLGGNEKALKSPRFRVINHDEIRETDPYFNFKRYPQEKWMKWAIVWRSTVVSFFLFAEVFSASLDSSVYFGASYLSVTILATTALSRFH